MADCGGTDTGHAAVMIYAEGTLPNTDVTVTGNLIRTTGATGIRVTEGNVGILLEGNQISGAELVYDISSRDVSLMP
jgi:lipopolysaccharide export system protein LptA